MQNLLDLDLAGLKAWLAQIGEKPFRANQLLRWIYQRGETDFSAMSDLARVFRDRLPTVAEIRLPTIVSDKLSDDGTRKFLMDVGASNLIETVFIPESDRGTLCISTQVGCALDCSFCSTGKQGFNRNLTTAEIIGQLWLANRALGFDPAGERIISNVVIMGMGEPLANYARVVAAVRRITAAPPDGFGISARSVTVSTVGLAPAIRKLADEHLGVTLALSLHTPDDELRDTLVPVNNRWKVHEVLDAARYYGEVTGRRVSIEYALIRDINDQGWRADLLGTLLHRALGPLAHVNLIPLNPTPGSKWDASPKPVEREFVRRVRAKGVSCTVRDTRGREIAAACGQLAAEGG